MKGTAIVEGIIITQQKLNALAKAPMEQLK